MESFLADLLRSLACDGVETPALIHDHRTGLRARVVGETINGIPRNNPAPNHPRTVRVYRAPSFGRLLYAPVSRQFPYWLSHVLRVEYPAILHLHLPSPSAFWAMSFPEARRVPWVVHWHADVVALNIDRRLKLAYPVYRQFEKRLLGRADSVIVSSPPYLERSAALAPWRMDANPYTGVHILVNIVYMGITVPLLAVRAKWLSGESDRQRKILLFLFMAAYGDALLHGITLVSFDWRYQLPAMLPFWIVAGCGFHACWRGR